MLETALALPSSTVPLPSPREASALGVVVSARSSSSPPIRTPVIGRPPVGTAIIDRPVVCPAVVDGPVVRWPVVRRPVVHAPVGRVAIAVVSRVAIAVVGGAGRRREPQDASGNR